MTVRSTCVFACLALFASNVLASDLRTEAPPEQAYSAFLEDRSSRFGFWVGIWDVNVLTPDDSGELVPHETAEASVYPILGKGAILELWGARSHASLGLHFYDAQSQSWQSWHLVQQDGRTAVQHQLGRFSHGRGEFKSAPDLPAEDKVTSAVSYSDVTPFSLRRDLHQSSDGGETWRRVATHEYTRSSVEPRPLTRRTLPTATSGQECTDSRFADFGYLVGSWESESARFEARSILNGCAVLGILEDSLGPDHFFVVTFDVEQERWTAWALSDDVETGFKAYAGASTWGELQASDDRTGSIEWAILHSGPGSLGDPGDKFFYRVDERSIEFVRP